MSRRHVVRIPFYPFIPAGIFFFLGRQESGHTNQGGGKGGGDWTGLDFHLVVAFCVAFCLVWHLVVWNVWNEADNGRNPKKAGMWLLFSGARDVITSRGSG